MIHLERSGALSLGVRLYKGAILMRRAMKRSFIILIVLASSRVLLAQTAEQRLRVETLDRAIVEAVGRSDYPRVLSLSNELIRLLIQYVGPDASVVGEVRRNRAVIYEQAEQWGQAAVAYQNWITWLERNKPKSIDLASALVALARAERMSGDLDGAKKHASDAFAISSSLDGGESASGSAMYQLGEVAEARRNYVDAETFYKRAVSLAEGASPRVDHDVINGWSALGYVYTAMGRYADAEPAYQRAVALSEKSQNIGDMLRGYNNLGDLYQHKAQYELAAEVYGKAVAIYDRTGEENDLLAILLDNMAELYRARGELSKAQPLSERALAIGVKVWGPDDPEVATILSNQALLAIALQDVPRALKLYERVIDIRSAVYGPDDPSVAATISDVAVLMRRNGLSRQAESALRQATHILEADDAEPDRLTAALNNLAVALGANGKHQEAERVLLRALAVQQKVNGGEHPLAAGILFNLVTEAWGSQRLLSARRFERRAIETEERLISLHTAIGSEETKRAFVRTLEGRLDVYISMHIQGAPRSLEARNLALGVLLQRKGRVLDLMSNEARLISTRIEPEFVSMYKAVADARAELAALVLQSEGVPERRQHIADVRKKVERLEASLSKASETFRQTSTPVTIASVSQVIPTDGMLLEFVLYNPYDVRSGRSQAPRYAVYAVGRNGIAQWAELGRADRIDQAVRQLRLALASSHSDPHQAAMRLWNLVIKPVSNTIRGRRRMFVSPDGQLNLVPFAALADENGKYLAAKFEFTYLTSGRDLLRLRTVVTPRTAGVVVAAPDYDRAQMPAGGQATDAEAVAVMLGDPRSAFAPLKGALAEGKDLAALLKLPQASLVTGSGATKESIRQLRGPQLLHMATHGYFSGGDSVQSKRTGQRKFEVLSSEPTRDWTDLDPLLRSGLALAGANRHAGGRNDGILTALEASGLDLWGTELVVLSACETAVGIVENGEGVYGLRRAFVLAGARTQVMSLWRVSDAETRRLMLDLYSGLVNGSGVSSSLAAVQRRWLAEKSERSHPYFWAAFIVSGDSTSPHSKMGVAAQPGVQ